MDRKGDLSKISSTYVLNCILKYVQYEDENFCLQLFKYSKDYQKKFDICLFDYKKKYIKNLQIFSLKKYLSYKYYDFKKFDLNILKKAFQKDLLKSKLKEEDMLKYLIHYYNKLIQNKFAPKNEESLIDVHSPLFEPFSKEKYFEEIFSIPISIKDNEAYINAFSKLNSNYPKLDLYYKNVDDIDYLDKIKINFSLLKRLNLQPEGDIVINNYSLLNSLFSLPNIKNNLIYLEIKGTLKEDEKPHFHFQGNNNLDELNKLNGSLNDFTSLEVLKLTSFAFIELFELKTSNLKELYLENCKNISFEGGLSLNLKKLSLLNNIIIEPKIKIISPELEELIFFGDYCHIFDFNSLEKLHNLNIEQFNIENYKNSPLKCISIERSNLSNEKQNIEKLISIKTLKKITIRLSGITDDEISKIKGKNYFVEDLNISWANQKCDCEIYNLLSKFPNLTNLEITSKNGYDNNLSTLEIKENPESKINKISISGQNKSIKFYIESFENLKYIFLNIDEIKNLEDTFPFFRNICNTEFKSLEYFEFRYITRTSDSKTNNATMLNNLYKSLDKMPYLQTFILSCSTKGVKVEFYEKLIQKLLSLRLKKIEMDIQKDLNLNYCKHYTANELQKIYPKKSYFGFENIIICKLK